MKHYIKAAIALFFLLCILFVPFIEEEWQYNISNAVFGGALQYISSLLFKQPLAIHDFSSDTKGMFILLIMLFILALLLIVFLKRYSSRICFYGYFILICFLAFVMLKYGAYKIFNLQFYSPEPNILYTPFGRLDKDILYWSVIGTSPVYSIITGTVEVITALLLLILRTRFIGLLLTIISLLQIVLINFSFDISVKMFSLLLLAMALYAAFPQIKILLRFLLKNKPVMFQEPQNVILPLYQKAALKTFIIGLIFLQIIPQLFATKNPNPLTGAYKVDAYLKDGQVADLCNVNIKRIFIHSKSYMIFQNEDDSVNDFHFTINEQKHELLLQGYATDKFKVRYLKTGDTLTLDFLDGRILKTIKLPNNELPALQNQFHFFIDDITTLPSGNSGRR